MRPMLYWRFKGVVHVHKLVPSFCIKLYVPDRKPPNYAKWGMFVCQETDNTKNNGPMCRLNGTVKQSAICPPGLHYYANVYLDYIIVQIFFA